MLRDIELIKKTKLLNNLTDEEINKYIKEGKFRKVLYNKNCVVHLDGEHCHKLEIILSGKLIIERIDELGNILAISDFIDDDIIGGNLLFSKNPYYPMTVSTQLPSIILEIDKGTLFEMFCNNSAFLQTYLEFISDNAFILGDKIKHYVNKTIQECVMSYIKYECKIQNTNHIKLKITKKALAEKIGVQRTSLSRELLKMKKNGQILFDSKTITLIKG